MTQCQLMGGRVDDADVMVLFLGEQPIPNLLPVRAYRPQNVFLVSTARTERVRRHLEPLLGVPSVTCLVEPYDVLAVERTVVRSLAERGWERSRLLFNLTGGTKLMVLAGYRLAERYASPFLYLEMEGVGNGTVYRHRFGSGGLLLEGCDVLPSLITIDEYLKAHVDTYHVTGASRDGGGKFEETVAEALEGVVDERLLGVKLGGALDIDLVVRCGNRVGIAEVKSGGKALSKEGISQLGTAGGREFLGIYTSRFLIIDTVWDHTRSNLRELAKLRGIELVELPSYRIDGRLSREDRQRLAEVVGQKLGCSERGR